MQGSTRMRWTMLGLAFVGGVALTAGAWAVAGAPDDALNGTWVVRGLRHRYTKRGGFTTLLLLAKSGGAAGGLGGVAGAIGGLL